MYVHLENNVYTWLVRSFKMKVAEIRPQNTY